MSARLVAEHLTSDLRPLTCFYALNGIPSAFKSERA